MSIRWKTRWRRTFSTQHQPIQPIPLYPTLRHRRLAPFDSIRRMPARVPSSDWTRARMSARYAADIKSTAYICKSETFICGKFLARRYSIFMPCIANYVQLPFFPLNIALPWAIDHDTMHFKIPVIDWILANYPSPNNPSRSRSRFCFESVTVNKKRPKSTLIRNSGIFSHFS